MPSNALATRSVPKEESAGHRVLLSSESCLEWVEVFIPKPFVFIDPYSDRRSLPQRKQMNTSRRRELLDLVDVDTAPIRSNCLGELMGEPLTSDASWVTRSAAAIRRTF